MFNRRIELCSECAEQVEVSPKFRGRHVLCDECRSRDHTHDCYISECDEEERRLKECEEEPWDAISEDRIGLPPISSVVRLKDYVIRLDVRGSKRLSAYDRSHIASPSSDK